MKPELKKVLGAGSGVIAGTIIFITLSVVMVSIIYQTKNKTTDYTVQPSSVNDTAAVSSLPVTGKTERLSIEDQLVKEIRQKYGDTITEKSTQIKLLKIKRYVLTLFRKDGNEKFITILKRAFPDMADEILKTIETMERYLAWEEKNKETLSKMSYLEKEGLLWEKRQEFFGDDAEDIWSEKIVEHERRKQEVRDTISELNNDYDSTIGEKLESYQKSLNDAYKDSPEEYLLRSRDLLTKIFFGMESVQNELSQMDSEERTLKINSIRREMGYSQKQIEQLEKLDNNRNNRWDNGLAYMDERDSLISSQEGPELETQLKMLREKYFKHEAKTIELEENDGFYRYTRTRVYGRN